MQQRRIVSLDLIRMVAILLVIMQHAWTGLQLDEPAVGEPRFFYHALVVMGVPLFFMLSGALLLGGSTLPVTDFLKRRFRRLLIPFVLWATIVYFVSAVMHKYPDVHTPMDILSNYIPYLLTDKINASYWYIFVLVGLYLLTPLLQRAFKGCDAKQLTRYVLILWMGWMVLRAYFPQFGSMHYYGASAFMYMGFFVCGHYCVTYLTDARELRLVCVISFLAAYAFHVWGLSAGVNTSVAHAVAVVSLFLLLRSCVVPNSMASLVISTGRYTYVIYFVHVLVVASLCMVDIWGWCPLWVRPVVITLLASVVSYMLAWMLDHLRFIPNAWVGI